MRKIVYKIIIVLVIGLILFLYNAFNGNPISKYIAKKNVQSYLSEHYPENEFNVTDGFYNFKFSEYNFDVIKIGDGKKYEFSVRGFWNRDIIDGIYYKNLDTSLMERLGEEASLEITDILISRGLLAEDILDISVHAEVLQGNYDDDTKWHKDLPIEEPFYFHLTLNSTDSSKEDFFDAVKIVKDMLDEEEYDYNRVSVNGNILGDPRIIDKDDIGYVKYAIGFNKNSKLKINSVQEYKQ